MRKALGPIVALALIGLGCAASVQETRMFQGPFGRTEIGGFVIAADPAASKLLVQTYDGDLWVFDVSSRVVGRLGTLLVGDEVRLAFDDRVAGRAVVSIDAVPAGRFPLPGGATTVAGLLPFGVVVGAPAIFPSRGAVFAGTGVLGPGVVTDIGAPRVFVPGGGAAIIAGGGGVIVPGFRSFSTLGAGPLGPQATQALGLLPAAAISPGTAVSTGFPPGRTPLTQGSFTPGTISPGVSTANPTAPGSPVVTGPFTPGTVAPGVSTTSPSAPGRPTPTGPFTPGTVAPGVSAPPAAQPTQPGQPNQPATTPRGAATPPSGTTTTAPSQPKQD